MLWWSKQGPLKCGPCLYLNATNISVSLVWCQEYNKSICTLYYFLFKLTRVRRIYRHIMLQTVVSILSQYQKMLAMQIHMVHSVSALWMFGSNCFQFFLLAENSKSGLPPRDVERWEDIISFSISWRRLYRNWCSFIQLQPCVQYFSNYSIVSTTTTKQKVLLFPLVFLTPAKSGSYLWSRELWCSPTYPGMPTNWQYASYTFSLPFLL